MSFNDFLNQAWNDHQAQSSEVAVQIPDAIRLIEQADQIVQFAHLVAHVFGEHLGRWDDGITVLNQLRQLSCYENIGECEQAVTRSIASLELASGEKDSVAELSTSDQVRALAIASSALTEQKNVQRAQQLLSRALDIAQSDIAKDDPANRTLAVTGNNLACALEERSTRSQAEIELMILAAQTARKYWQIAGGWLQVERAEYRLSKTFFKAEDLLQSLEHAQACLKIVQENNAPALEFFFGYEALASAELERGNTAEFTKAAVQANAFFEQLSDEDQSWCKPYLDALK